jgi:hypothetical protein
MGLTHGLTNAHLGKMNIYTVIAIDNPEAAGAAVARAFPGDFLAFTTHTWLVAGTGTAQDVCGRLGLPIETVQAGQLAPTFNAIVTLVAGYFGYAPMNIWEWVKAKQAQLAPTSAPGQLAGQ